MEREAWGSSLLGLGRKMLSKWLVSWWFIVFEVQELSWWI